jgi:hypothetical protein
LYAFYKVIGYLTTSGPIRKNPQKLQFLKVKSDDNANFLGVVGGFCRILDSNVVVVDDEEFPVVDKEVLIGSLHEDNIPHIHAGDSKHYYGHIQWYYIQFYFIYKINTYNKFNLALI